MLDMTTYVDYTTYLYFEYLLKLLVAFLSTLTVVLLSLTLWHMDDGVKGALKCIRMHRAHEWEWEPTRHRGGPWELDQFHDYVVWASAYSITFVTDAIAFPTKSAWPFLRERAVPASREWLKAIIWFSWCLVEVLTTLVLSKLRWALSELWQRALPRRTQDALQALLSACFTRCACVDWCEPPKIMPVLAAQPAGFVAYCKSPTFTPGGIAAFLAYSAWLASPIRKLFVAWHAVTAVWCAVWCAATEVWRAWLAGPPPAVVDPVDPVNPVVVTSLLLPDETPSPGDWGAFVRFTAAAVECETTTTTLPLLGCDASDPLHSPPPPPPSLSSPVTPPTVCRLSYDAYGDCEPVKPPPVPPLESPVTVVFIPYAVTETTCGLQVGVFPDPVARLCVLAIMSHPGIGADVRMLVSIRGEALYVCTKNMLAISRGDARSVFFKATSRELEYLNRVRGAMPRDMCSIYANVCAVGVDVDHTPFPLGTHPAVAYLIVALIHRGLYYRNPMTGGAIFRHLSPGEQATVSEWATVALSSEK